MRNRSRSNASGCRRSVSDECPIVGDDVLALGRRGQLGIGFGERAAGEQRRQPLDAGDVPRRAVPMAGERRERVGVGESREVAAVERGAMREVGDVGERPRSPRFDDALRAGFGSPAIIRKPRRSAGSASRSGHRALSVSSVQSHSLTVTSTGRTSTPCRRASCTSCDGA